jgi:subtilase family serine protease
MRHLICAALLGLAAFSTPAIPAHAQGIPGFVVLPDSSVEHAGDKGVRAHTNYMIHARPQFGYASPTGETPASIRSVYGLPAANSGGSGAIAIVDAYHYPTALNDFNVFSNTFGLPRETSSNPLADSNTVFEVVYASGVQPRSNGGWAQEAALDIEWAHAMAPSAKIYLVEANTNSFSDLLYAVQVASGLPGVKQVSMSWGSSEFSGEVSYDSYFQAPLAPPGVVYFASAGDTGGVTNWPGTSPYVVSAGGTTINRNKGVFVNETAWSGSGGGPSKYEPRPVYQDTLVTQVGAARGTPDFSFDANPSTGVSVYCTTKYQGYSGWLVFGGTSVSSPSLAGIVNLAGGNALSSGDELAVIYGNLGNNSIFRDIASGQAGSFYSVPGWDFITGVGSNQGLSGK